MCVEKRFHNFLVCVFLISTSSPIKLEKFSKPLEKKIQKYRHLLGIPGVARTLSMQLYDFIICWTNTNLVTRACFWSIHSVLIFSYHHFIILFHRGFLGTRGEKGKLRVCGGQAEKRKHGRPFF